MMPHADGYPSGFFRWRRVIALSLVVVSTLFITANAFAQDATPDVSPAPTANSSDPTPAPDASASPDATASQSPSASPSSTPTVEQSATPAPTPTSDPSPSSAPTLTSDAADYAPGATVALTGSGWPFGESVSIFVNDNVGSTWSDTIVTTADGNGVFVVRFNLPNTVIAEYKATATGSGGETASVTFTDSPVPSNSQLEQWDGSAWITGEIGSGYTEGDTVPFRLDVGGVTGTAGDPATFPICRDYQNGSDFGYFKLNPYDTTQAATPGGTITSSFGPVSGVNVTITSVVETGTSGVCVAGARETDVTFTATGGSTQYVLWGGELASPLDPGVGAGHGAGEYPGSSLAMRTGNQNRSIKVAGIIQLAQITVQKIVDAGSATPDQWCFNMSPNPNNVALPLCPASGTDSVVFFGLSTGNYTVTETSISGYAFASGTGTNCTFSGSTATASVATATTPTDATCVFHNTIQTGSILVTKYQDTNGDGSQAATGEPGLQNWSIFIDTDNSHTLNGTESAQTTNASGQTTFTGLTPGNYSICEVLATGWHNSDPGSDSAPCKTVSVTANSQATAKLGNYQNGSITGHKYNDPNSDGDLSDGVAMPDWTIRLYNGDGSSLLTSATTNSSGVYTFPDLAPGSYLVCEVLPNGTWHQSAPGGTDCDSISGVASGGFPVTITSNLDVTGKDFGNYQSNTTTTTQLYGSASPNDPVNDDASVPIGSSVYDTASLSGTLGTAGGSVSFFYRQVSTDPNSIPSVTGTTCTSGTQIGSNVTVTNGVPVSGSDDQALNAAGVYEFWAVYSGDLNNLGSASTCGSETVVVPLKQPAISTQVKNGSSNVSDGGSVAIGSSLGDAASFTTNPASGGSPAATVSYYWAGPLTAAQDAALTCTAVEGTQLGSNVTVSGTTIPASTTTVPLTDAGTYEFWAIYSGDSNNLPATSTCRSETVVVDKNTTTSSTQVKNTNGTLATGDDTNVADGGQVPNPTTVYDTVTLGGATSGATGMVSYYYKKTSSDPSTIPTPDCTTGGTLIGSAVSVTGGSAPASSTVPLNAAGVYEFWAVYTGDGNNLGSTSTCGAETVVVPKNTTSTATQVKRTTGNTNVVDNSTVPNGTSVYDTATLTGKTSNAGGTVTYFYKKTSSDPSTIPTPDCTTGGTQIGNTPVTVASGVVPNSSSVVLSAAGVYEFWAVYSGDGNNLGSTSTCGSETVVVPLNTTSIATQVKLASGNSNVADGGTLVQGTTVYDTATLTGKTANAGGTVTYYVQKQTTSTPTCNAGTSLGAKTVLNGVVPKSDNYTFPTSGVYEFWAVYSGDPNNLGSTSACGSETVQVLLNTGAHTIGFWRNKNGQDIITKRCAGTSGTSLYTFLTQFNPFKDLTSSTCSTIAKYVTNVIDAASSSGSSMNPMLKAQMLATALSVYFSDPALGGNQIGAAQPLGGVVIDLTKICADASAENGTCKGGFEDVGSAFGGATSLTVMQTLLYENNVSNSGGSTWYANVKSTQELAKDTFDAINNNVVFGP